MLILKKFLIVSPIVLLVVLGSFGFLLFSNRNVKATQNHEVLSVNEKGKSYWFLLHRKSNIEYLYQGDPGDKNNSNLVKTFNVKVGIAGERPTPLPQLLGREYWVITEKAISVDPETAPYFITLDIPATDQWPYGPTPYLECNGQCDWITVGYFGLHGVNGNSEKLSESDPGSSGCIRHKDSDITYLYNILEPEKEEIRYYIVDI